MEQHHDRSALASQLLGLAHALEHAAHVVALQDVHHRPPERLKLGAQVGQVHHLLSGAIDLLVIVIHRAYQIVHPLGTSKHGGLPYLAFLQLAVAVHGEHQVAVARHLLAKRGADANAHALTQRAAGHAYARQAVCRRGVALQPCAELAEGRKLAHREEATPRHSAVDDGRNVALRHEEHVLAVATHGETLRVELHDVPLHGHKPVGRAHRAAWVAALSCCGHAEYVAAHLCGQCFQFLYCLH